MSDIAVFYLARWAEGLAHFDAFARSLREHPAGMDYDLILICKGFTRPTQLAAVSAMFKGIPHQVTMVEDSIGQDIHSYKAVAPRFPHTHVCFMNTFTRINADNWLKKLFDAMSLPDVGMVGATASLESLNNSWELLNRVEWLVTHPARYDAELSQSFEWIIKHFHPVTGAALRSRKKRLRRWLGDRRSARPRIDAIMDGHEKAWDTVTSEGAPFNFAAKYPHFPNPHIRSNVFMLLREDMIRMPLKDGHSKLAGCDFESGPDGLSARMLKRGKRLLLVGANGKAYDIENWAMSGTFRSKNQENLLATDNQTRSFDVQSPAERKTHSIMAWSSYLAGNPDSLYGIKFDSQMPLSELRKKKEVLKSGEGRLLSIVIPTHNRLELTLDAIKTIRAQNYQNWEIAVFDNASSEDVSAAIRSLRDSRIRCERSDEFLPVTKSWNRAMNMARGEYVTLIGDDDGLAPGFFERIVAIADRFGNPDVIYSSLYQFFHPGVLPDRPLGLLQMLPTADFMRQRYYPFVLDKAAARRAVDNSLQLRRTFMFNMPAFTARRDFLDTIRRDGEVLHPPFPDYYFANLVFDKAKKIVVEPKPIAFQGISTASFGFTLFNQKTEDGFKVLGHKLQQDALFGDVGHHLLPGPGYHSQYIMTMAHLAKAIGDPERQPNFSRYRRLQIYHYLSSRGFPLIWQNQEDGKIIWEKLSLSEKIDAYKMIAIVHFNKQFPKFTMASRLGRDVSMHAFSPKQELLNDGDYIKGSDVFEALADQEDETLKLTKGEFITGLPLVPGTRVVQQFKMARPVLNAVSIQLYSFGKAPTDYEIDWTIKARVGDRLLKIGEGKLSTANFFEWTKHKLKTSHSPPDVTAIEVEISVSKEIEVDVPVYLPLFQILDEGKLPLPRVNGEVFDKNVVVGLDVAYDKSEGADMLVS